MAGEARIQLAILLAWGATPHLRLWRANVGVGWFLNGEPARKTDRGAYPVSFGIPGQADLSGITNTGRRLEIECKGPRGRQSEDQKRFQAMIARFGGIYILAASVADVDLGLALYGITR